MFIPTLNANIIRTMGHVLHLTTHIEYKVLNVFNMHVFTADMHILKSAFLNVSSVFKQKLSQLLLKKFERINQLEYSKSTTAIRIKNQVITIYQFDRLYS